MKTFVFFADQENLRRSDQQNTVVATGADEAAARIEAAKLIGSDINGFKAVELSEATPPFAVEGGWPISFCDQDVFAKLTRNGNTMRATPDAV